MKKSYSRLNILQERFSSYGEAKGFFKYMLNQRKVITVTVPYYEYLRGIVFCDDLKENFIDEVPFQFDLTLLIFLLYDDFLAQIKRGSAKNEQISNYLLAGKKKYFQQRTVEKKIIKPLNQYLLTFETIEEEEEAELSSEEEKKAYLDIRIKETEVLRGEILLNDLEPFMMGTNITIEELITIVYLDFIENIKQQGNSVKVQKSILAHLKRF